MDQRHIRFLAELPRMPARQACWSSASKQFDRLGTMGFHYYAHAIESGLELCSRVLEKEVPRACLGHGDFAPWNICVEAGNLVVLDWEYGAPTQPPLWDLFHFVIQTAIELDAHRASEIYRQLDELRRYCGVLDVPEQLFEPLLIAYACESLSANLLLHGTAPDHKDRMARSTLGSLLAILVRPGACAI